MGGRGARGGIHPGGGGGGRIPGGGGGGGIIGGRGGRGLVGGGGAGGAGGGPLPPGQGPPGSGGNPGTPVQGRFERREGALTAKYRKQLEDRFKEGNDDAKRVYDDYIPRGGAVSNGKNRDGAYYRPYFNDIEMSFRKDSEANGKEAGSTWFHEHGHFLDHNAGLPSRNEAFYRAIVNDIRAFEDEWLADHGISRSDITDLQLRRNIGREMALKGSALTHAIQDIYGGVYREYNAFSGGFTMWGHSWDYWTRSNQAMEVTSESWAHMFNAAFSVQEQEAMREYLPSAWAWFQRRLGGI